MSHSPDLRSPAPGQVTPARGIAPEGGHVLCPEAYLHTLSRGEPERLPALRPWILALSALVALLAVLSFPLWHEAVGELARLVAGVGILGG